MPTCVGSHQSSLPYSETAWTHATWMACTLSQKPLYVLVSVRNLASAALASFMHRLWCSLNVRCASIQTPSQRVSSVLNCMAPFRTLVFGISFGLRCLLWPSLHANSAASFFAVSNCSPRLLAHSMLFAAHLSCMETRWLTSLLLPTKPRLSTKYSPSTSDTYSLTHLISPEV